VSGTCSIDDHEATKARSHEGVYFPSAPRALTIAMPLYEYRCESCDHQFEVIQKFSDPPIAVCPKCAAGPVVKLMSSPAFQFKGSGWYITDYARKDSKDKGGETATKTEKTEAKESKPDTSSTTAPTPTPAKSE
jgi:putative FmdB family regulatory protein